MPDKELRSGITVGELIDRLKGHDPDAAICFGSDDDFTFNRVKSRGDGIVQIGFLELSTIHYELTDLHPKHPDYREPQAGE